MNKFDTQKIIDYIQKNPGAKAGQIAQFLGITTATVHNHLRRLRNIGIILKSGKPPHTKYLIAYKREVGAVPGSMDYQKRTFLDHHYLNYDVDGTELAGADGFASWCNERKLDPIVQFPKYKERIEKVNKQRDICGLIDSGYERFLSQVGESKLENLLYLDVYQIGHFGSSSLGALAFYAKQSQSVELIEKLASKTRGQINCHIQNENYDGVCYVPHSLKRRVQLMPSLRKAWDINLPEITLQKLYAGPVIVPQKSLKSIEQRIRNARETIYIVPNQKPVDHLLLIDDFVGSGATLNESAAKILEAGLAKKVTGLALVGNIDMTYDVINEV